MATRIRELRKSLKLTLKEVAKKAGTTAQTIQRLETEKMTVSVEWLERIASVLGVRPADLLSTPEAKHVVYLGKMSSNGLVADSTACPPARLHNIDLSGMTPVAAVLAERAGPFDAGTILIANRLGGVAAQDLRKADGLDCIVSLKRGAILFRRVILSADDSVTLVPYESDIGLHRAARISWLAPLIVTVRYVNCARDNPASC